jgi:GST-like protein
MNRKREQGRRRRRPFRLVTCPRAILGDWYVLYRLRRQRSGAFSAEAALAEAGAQLRIPSVSLEKERAEIARIPCAQSVRQSAGAQIAERRDRDGIGRNPAHGRGPLSRSRLIPPHATFARAEAYRWIAFMASEIYPMVEIVDYPERFVPAGAEAEALKARAIARIRERMLLVEAAIAGPWLLAHEFSRPTSMPRCSAAGSVGKDWRGKHLPKLNALVEKLAARPRIAPVWQKHFGAG